MTTQQQLAELERRQRRDVAIDFVCAVALMCGGSFLVLWLL